MTALAIALGVVGLAAVLAARDVAVRWLAEREQAEALAELEMRVRAEIGADVGSLVLGINDRIGALEEAHKRTADIARQSSNILAQQRRA